MTDIRPFARAMLSVAEGIPPASLEAALIDVAPTLPVGMQIGCGFKVEGDPLAGTPHRNALGDSLSGYEGYVEISSALGGEASLAAVSTVLTRVVGELQPLITTARSSLIVGNRHLLLPLQAPYLMIFVLRRRPELSHEEFMDYWYNRHGKLIANGNSSGSYYQLHAHQEFSQTTADRCSFLMDVVDGHAGGWISDFEKLNRSLSSKSAIRALQDEARFIDHRRSCMHIYKILSGSD